MSRIANKPLTILSGVKVILNNGTVNVEGPKGKLSYVVMPTIKLEMKGNEIDVKRPNDSIASKTAQGTSYRLIQNMMIGVTQGFEKKLQIQGVGFKAELKGKKLILLLGFSHPVEMNLPDGIEVKVGKPTELTVSGISKQLVGHFAANIRAAYEPEPYKGKGIRYENEQVRRKAGKAVAK